MNNEFVSQAAAKLIERPDVASISPPQEKLLRLFALVYGRLPSESELQRTTEFLGETPDPKRWQHLAQGLLMANEFIFVD